MRLERSSLGDLVLYRLTLSPAEIEGAGATPADLARIDMLDPSDQLAALSLLVGGATIERRTEALPLEAELVAKGFGR